MHFDAAADHHEAKDVIAGNGVAAAGEAVIDLLQAFSNEQHVVLARRLGDGWFGGDARSGRGLDPNELVFLDRKSAQTVQLQITGGDA